MNRPTDRELEYLITKSDCSECLRPAVDSSELTLKNLCLKTIAYILINEDKFKNFNITLNKLPTEIIYEIENTLYRCYGNLIWKIAADSLEKVTINNQLKVNVVALSANNQFIVSSVGLRLALIWDLKSGKLMHLLGDHIAIVKCLAISPSCKFVVTGSCDTTAIVWKSKSGKLVCIFEEHKTPIESLAISPNSDFVVSGSADGKIKAWDIRSGICFFDSGDLNSKIIKSLAVSPDNKLIVGISQTSAISFWNLDLQTVVKNIEKGPPDKSSFITCAAISQDNNLIVTGNVKGFLFIWDLKFKRGMACHSIRNIKAHNDCITAIAISINNAGQAPFIVTGSVDTTVKVWDAKSFLCLCILSGHKSIVSSVVISENNKYIVTGSADKSIKIWKISLKLQEILEKINNLKGACPCEIKYKKIKSNQNCIAQ